MVSPSGYRPSGVTLNFDTSADRIAAGTEDAAGGPIFLSEGQLCYDRETGKHYRWDGSTWDVFGEGGVGGGAPTDADYLVGTANGDLSAEIVVGTSPGGELGGTWASPTVDATHSGSTHAATQAAAEATAASALTTHESDTSTHGATVVAGTEDITFETLDAAGDVGTSASTLAEGDHTHVGGGGVDSINADAAGALTGDVTLSEGANVTLTTVGNDIEIAATGASGAPSTVDYLVGTADAGLDAEIVVGTTPGGELGGTWASPTVDATHSGSTHVAATDTHIADTSAAHAASAVSADSTTLVGVGTDVQAVLEELDNADVDHAAAADPHTGYRLESADHTHASTGAQAGQLDHGTALTGLTDDDHTQYRLESADHTHQSTGAQAGTLDHGLALTGLTDDDHTQYVLESTMTAVKFSVGALIDGGGAAVSTGFKMVWRAPFACTVTNVRGHVDTGTTTVINARKNQASDFLASDYTITAANAWEDGGSVQNTSIAAGDDIEVEIVTAGTATEVNIQVDLTRAMPS